MHSPHRFHIPVMGIGFTIDTPLKVARFGISSVIFISDDILIEKMRKMYSEKHEIPFTAIPDHEHDYRAKRITAYLDLIHDLVQHQMEELCNPSNTHGHKQYFDLLPENSGLKANYNTFIAANPSKSALSSWLRSNLVAGSIDVNIMTKIDKENYKDKEKLSSEYNDAHAALRGFANSKLDASVVFSAGMNPRLFSYAANLTDLLPDENGDLKKRIILKVSDYRSALIQGKFLAKKGLWVSEYRIESGLNCGGHAFATNGFLMGPILEEFKEKREELITDTKLALINALEDKNVKVKDELSIRITAQGGVGTNQEQQFLLDHYRLDSIGWGSPFLLVPEATSVDENTIQKLVMAQESDLYLSNISPLGVPFNNLKGNTNDLQRLSYIAKGRPGSSCPRKYLSLNKEFTDQPICTASRQYQHLKLEKMQNEMTKQEYKKESQRVMESSCLCVGLGTSALLVNDIEHKVEGDSVLICPGPNMAYFSKKVSLQEMVGHIYGKVNIIEREDRPHMFIKEFALYLDFLNNKIKEWKVDLCEKQKLSLHSFIDNLRIGMNYYKGLYAHAEYPFDGKRGIIYHQLENFSAEMDKMEALLLGETKIEEELVAL